MEKYGLIFLLAIFIISIGAGAFGGQILKPEPPSNIIIISVDTLSADHVGTYGYDLNTTPNIDRFANDSVVFKRPITQGTWTRPGVASLFTSEYPSVHGLSPQGKMRSNLTENAITMAEVLRNNGYTTAAFVGSIAGRKGGGILDRSSSLTRDSIYTGRIAC